RADTMDDLARGRLAGGLWLSVLLIVVGLAQEPSLPSRPLHYGFFTVQFAADGTFTLEGEGMTAKGTWKRTAAIVQIESPAAQGEECRKPVRYTFSVSGSRLALELIGDDPCVMRRMVLDHSAWLPVGEAEAVPVRKIVRTAATSLPELPKVAPDPRSWPSFR